MSKRVGVAVAVVVLLAAVPIWFESFWLQTGLFAMAAVIAAIGLTILVGIAGQLSLAHAFFVAIGAYGYAYLADKIPPVAALVAAVLLAGLAGALFSPIAGRVRGIYLGLASLGLVFLGQHILQNATGITGGYRGIAVPPFSVFGFEFTGADGMVVLGVPYGPLEKLWYLGLVLVAAALWYGRNLVRSRPGRALATVRDSEVAAATNGIDVVRYKAAAFTVSSMYAGLGGVLMALAFGRIVPESFGLLLSIDFLVMVVIGGAGSVGGAAAGAVFVTALPLILNHYSGSLPLLAEPGSGGVGAPELSRLLYGAAIVVVLLFARDGLAGLVHRKERVV
ncbi:amino acid/amide ABC transporter membrane protein 2 (HAAT family) [Solirubrobacter pauli]|uniref:Amino acid/amide ABC transporter membrane protein 2 (HAAT family) n=1 Tax=Solirubrobacter pauli TaxID=166793 RepID=A0A660LD26_9ACTN|nr:branched-chain amino acid ABC transporter permease [Solirubrobacter pauli]RKQ92155.1 amino acid/amide ABC transporter membrane protein 2 (HAAT family) [Solirubrobacter pauli]